MGDQAVNDPVVVQRQVPHDAARWPHPDIDQEMIDIVDLPDACSGGRDDPGRPVVDVGGREVGGHVPPQLVELRRLVDDGGGQRLVQGDGQAVDGELDLTGHLIRTDVEQHRRGAQRVRVGASGDESQCRACGQTAPDERGHTGDPTSSGSA